MVFQAVLEQFPFTEEKQGVVQGLVEGRVMQLIEEHVCHMLNNFIQEHILTTCVLVCGPASKYWHR